MAVGLLGEGLAAKTKPECGNSVLPRTPMIKRKSGLFMPNQEVAMRLSEGEMAFSPPPCHEIWQSADWCPQLTIKGNQPFDTSNSFRDTRFARSMIWGFQTESPSHKRLTLFSTLMSFPEWRPYKEALLRGPLDNHGKAGQKCSHHNTHTHTHTISSTCNRCLTDLDITNNNG